MTQPPTIIDTGWMIWLPKEGRYVTNGQTQFPTIWTYKPASTANQWPVKVKAKIEPISAPEKSLRKVQKRL